MKLPFALLTVPLLLVPTSSTPTGSTPTGPTGSTPSPSTVPLSPTLSDSTPTGLTTPTGSTPSPSLVYSEPTGPTTPTGSTPTGSTPTGSTPTPTGSTPAPSLDAEKEEKLCCVCEYHNTQSCWSRADAATCNPPPRLHCRWLDPPVDGKKCVPRHYKDCLDWKKADAQKDCDEIAIVEYDKDDLDSDGGLKDCTEVRNQYEGHGTGCEVLTERIKVCLNAFPDCTIFDFDDTGCSTFRNLEDAEKEMKELSELLGGDQCVIVSANQCTAANGCQNRYIWTVKSNGICEGKAGDCQFGKTCRRANEVSRCTDEDDTETDQVCCCNDEGKACKWQQGKTCPGEESEEEKEEEKKEEGGGSCFPGHAMVQVENQGQVAMKDLVVGDNVLVANGKYEPIYSFGHYDTAAMESFVTIKTDSKCSTTLEMTKDHLLFVQTDDDMLAMRADNVSIGDIIVSGEFEPCQVVEVSAEEQEGLFMPLTKSGSIVVNGKLHTQAICSAIY
jgi:hypothetical protein